MTILYLPLSRSPVASGKAMMSFFVLPCWSRIQQPASAVRSPERRARGHRASPTLRESPSAVASSDIAYMSEDEVLARISEGEAPAVP